MKSLQDLTTTFGASTAIALCAWIWERRANGIMQDRLLKLAIAQTEANLKNEAAINALRLEQHR